MAQIFRIAKTSKIGDNNLIVCKQKVPKELFYHVLNVKVKEVTQKQPERFDEVLEQVNIVLVRTNVTIMDTWFEIKGKA